MLLTRCGYHRYHGETVIIDSKQHRTKHLEIIFKNIPDFNNTSARYVYTLRFSEAELNKLLKQRDLENRRKLLAGAAAIKNADTKELVFKLLDRDLEEDADRKLFGLKLRTSSPSSPTAGGDAAAASTP